MQHADIDSVSTPPMLTGTSFSSVSSSPRFFDQYKTIPFSHSMPGLDISALKEPLRFIANHRCCEAGVNALSLNADNPLPWAAAMANLRNTKNIFETRVADIRSVARCSGICGA